MKDDHEKYHLDICRIIFTTVVSIVAWELINRLSDRRDDE